jgi:hypothetical protein
MCKRRDCFPLTILPHVSQVASFGHLPANANPTPLCEGATGEGASGEGATGEGATGFSIDATVHPTHPEPTQGRAGMYVCKLRAPDSFPITDHLIISTDWQTDRFGKPFAKRAPRVINFQRCQLKLRGSFKALSRLFQGSFKALSGLFQQGSRTT